MDFEHLGQRSMSLPKIPTLHSNEPGIRVRHPVYDDNGRCQGEKAQTGAWCWKRSQGRPLLAFISTLDGVSSTRIIAPGWKRSAFAFS